MLFSAYGAEEYAHITMDDGLKSNYVTSVHRDENGFVWIATAEGISLFDGVRVRSYDLNAAQAGASAVRVNRIIHDTRLGLSLATSRGLYTFNYLEDRFSLSVESESALFCALQSGDYILMGSDGGLIVKSLSGGDVMNFLEGEKIVALCKDDRRTYILTQRNLYSIKIPTSAAKATAFELRVLHESDGGNFSDMAIDSNLIYIGTDRRGVLEYNAENNELHPLDNFGANIVRSLSLEGDMLYVASDGRGAIQYDLSKREIVKHITQNNSGLKSNAITCIDADSEGLLWLGSYSTGVSYLQPSDGFIKQIPSTGDFCARCIYRVASNRFIIGTRDGVVLWRDGHVEGRFQSGDYAEIESGIILSILPYRDYQYIVGTFGGGVFLLDEQLREVYPFDLDEQLSAMLKGQSVYDIEEIDGTLYFFTLKGLVKYSEQQGVEVWDDQNSAMPSSLIYSQCYDATCNKFWVGTSKGLCSFDIKENRVDSVALKSVENDFRINMIYIDDDNNLLVDRKYVELLRIDSDTFEVEQINFAPASLDHISGIIEDNNGKDLWIATTNGLYCYNEQDGQSIKFMQSSGLESTNICPNATLKLPDNRVYVGTEAGMYSFHPQPTLERDRDRVVYLSSAKINGEESLGEVLKRSLTHEGSQRQYVIKSGLKDMVEIEVVDPLFRRAQENKYAFSLDGDNWHYAESNSFVVGNNLAVGRYPLYVRIVRGGDTSWGDAIPVGYVVVGLSPSTMIWMGAVLLLIIMYVIFWRSIRKLILVNKRKAGSRMVADDKRQIEVLEIIKESLERDQGYKNPTFRLKDLADSTSLSSSEISYVLNNYLNTSFSDFINDYRIEEVKKLLLEEDANYYMLHVLAERCGFNSKTSFYRIFKNKTGLTPLQYRKQEMGEGSVKSEKP